jgi:hypothetical protein
MQDPIAYDSRLTIPQGKGDYNLKKDTDQRTQLGDLYNRRLMGQKGASVAGLLPPSQKSNKQSSF